jgi:hypothetical protein
MPRHAATLILVASSVAASAVLALGFPAASAVTTQAATQTGAPRHATSQASPLPNDFSEAPSAAEIDARAQRLAANQHRDDEALKQYERVERHTDLTAGPNPRTLEDRTFRVVPTGTGTLKILLKENGTPTNPTDYRRQLQAWEDVLQLMLRPEDSRAKSAYEKYDRRNQQRAEFIDTMIDSFTPKWLGRETLNGRTCDVFQLDLKPDFHPHSMLQDALSHISAKAWVDRDSDQLVRGEAHIMRDIWFGGGILGKVYRGGVFSMEQGEVAPGIWEPTRYQYDFGGRKFFFSFDEHQVVEASHYHRVGPPKEALILVQNELASAKPMAEIQ